MQKYAKADDESAFLLAICEFQVLGKPDPRCKLRHTDFVEMTAPLLSSKVQMGVARRIRAASFVWSQNWGYYSSTQRNQLIPNFIWNMFIKDGMEWGILLSERLGGKVGDFTFLFILLSYL